MVCNWSRESQNSIDAHVAHKHVLVVYPWYFLIFPFFFQHILQGTVYPWCLSHDEKLMCKNRTCGFPLQITVTMLMYLTLLIGLKKAVSHFLQDSFSNRFYMLHCFASCAAGLCGAVRMWLVETFTSLKGCNFQSRWICCGSLVVTLLTHLATPHYCTVTCFDGLCVAVLAY